MTFRVGQRVVCIDDTPMLGRIFTLRRGALKRDAIYTIRDYVAQTDWIAPLICDEPCVRLNEIERRYDRIGFRESRFRPLLDEVEKKSAKRRTKESV